MPGVGAEKGEPMRTERTDRREALGTRLVRGVVGGLLSGAVFVAVTMWFAASVGDPAKGPLLMMSTIVKGSGAMENGTASVGAGVAVHLVLSALFGAAFALVAPKLRTNGTTALAGTLYGAVLYLVNFELVAPVAFPVFEMANQPFELLAHVVFGTLLSVAFFSSGVRRHEPVVALA